MKISPEFVSFDNNLPYMVRIFHDVNFDYPVHYHADEFEITLTEGCEGTLIAGNRVTRFGNPDLVLTGPGLPHAWYEPGEVKNIKGRKVTVIHFKKGLIPAEWLDSIEYLDIKKLLSLSLKGIQFNSKKIEHQYTFFSKLKEGQGVENFILIMNILRGLATGEEFTLLSDAGLSLHDTGEEDLRFREVHSFIVQNFKSGITLSQVAEIANLSKSAFSHYFKKHSLKSFSEFIIDLRLNHAAYLLVKTRKAITEIAYQSGFNSISNFNNLFKRKFHMTPRECRRHDK